jgi:hypothetical protein
MAARTIRVFWPKRTTGWVNFNWVGVINAKSVVHVAVSEGALPQQPQFGFPLDVISRFRGAATMFVKNVHPHDEGGGGVEFFVQIDWPSPLNVVTDITVDAPEDGFIVE